MSSPWPPPEPDDQPVPVGEPTMGPAVETAAGDALPARPFELPPPQPPPDPTATAAPRTGDTGAKVLFWGGLLLMICASAALVGDWAARNYETTRLLSAIEASEGQMKQAQDSILAVDVPDDPAPDVAQDIEEQLRETAAAGRRGVADAGVGVGRISFLPWHADLVSAQAAYLAHNRAWEDYLEAGAEDPESLFAGGNQIEPTWRRAEFEVREAVPPLPWPGLSDRVETIFTEEEGSSGPSRDVSA